MVQLLWTFVTFMCQKNVDLNMILIVPMELLYIRHSFLNFTAALMNTFEFISIMVNLPV